MVWAHRVYMVSHRTPTAPHFSQSWPCSRAGSQISWCLGPQLLVLCIKGGAKVCFLMPCLLLKARNTEFRFAETSTETIDGKKSYDPPPHSKEMLQLNKSFGRLHGISSLINLVGFAATLYYGTVLANRLS